jgi:hypothetical protein
MPSQRDPTPVVVLATNSPLYAPILLAQVQARNQTCAKMKLELARYPSAFVRASTDVDPFIDRVLSQADVDKTILIGIGDPMRVTAVPSQQRKFARAKIVGGLLQRMCYWLVDSREFDGEVDRWEDAFERILVHPPGMTGFTVPCYDYYIRTQQEDLAPFIRRLFDDMDPNDESGVYDRFRTKLSTAKPEARPLAFVTMNPLHASRASSFAGQYTLVRSFVEQEHFRDAIMTALIVARDVAESTGSREVQALEEFSCGVARAVDSILNDPERSASQLWYALESNDVVIRDSDGLRVMPFFESWGPTALAEALRTLANTGALNEDDGLRITHKQWETTKAMRRVVEPFLPAMERKVAVGQLPQDVCNVS